jgi:hypothetical protein
MTELFRNPEDHNPYIRNSCRKQPSILQISESLRVIQASNKTNEGAGLNIFSLDIGVISKNRESKQK